MMIGPLACGGTAARRRLDHKETIRGVDRQRMQQHRREQGKGRGRRTDRARERDDGRERGARPFRQPAKGELEFIHVTSSRIHYDTREDPRGGFMKPVRTVVGLALLTLLVDVAAGVARQTATPYVVVGTPTELGLAGYAKILCSAVFV